MPRQRWQFVLDTEGVRVEATKAKQRRVAWRLDDSAEASFTIRGTHEQAGAITELVTDLIVYVDGVPLYRGTVGPTGDELAGVGHDVNVSTGDYRARLHRRILYAANQLVWTGVEQRTILWNLVQETQGNAGGDLGITDGTSSGAAVARDRTYAAGQNIGEAMDQLGRVIDGFEWEVDATLALNRWNPQRGENRGIVLDYGGLVRRARREVNPADFFTSLRLNGDDALVAEEREDVDIATRPEGRWDKQLGETSIVLQTTLEERADRLIEDGPVVQPSYVVTLAPDRWEGPGHIWLGDTVRLRIRSLPRLDVDAEMRVHEVAATLNTNGRPTIELVLNAPRPDFMRRLPHLSRRLTDLERR